MIKKISVCILCMLIIITSLSFVSFGGNVKSEGWGVAKWYCEKNNDESEINSDKIISDLVKEYNKKWGTNSEDEWSSKQYEEFIEASDTAINKANQSKYNITVAFSMPEDTSYFYDYVSICKPYVYITKDGETYSKTYLKLGNYDEKYATACLTIEGNGEYIGIICHNENDNIPTAQSENYGTFSSILITIYDGGIKCKYTDKMNSTMATEINNMSSYSSSQITESSNKIYFKDVTEDKWYYNNINIAAEMGLINGNGLFFYPMENLSYAEAITIASRINAINKNLELSSTFDTNCTPWYQTYIDYAEENDIPCNYDNMNVKISRADFVHIFYAALPKSKYKTINDVPDNSIPDVSMTYKYSKEIYKFYRAGILSGSDYTKSFYPDTKIKRCEVATILCRMIGKNRIKY